MNFFDKIKEHNIEDIYNNKCLFRFITICLGFFSLISVYYIYNWNKYRQLSEKESISLDGNNLSKIYEIAEKNDQKFIMSKFEILLNIISQDFNADDGVFHRFSTSINSNKNIHSMFSVLNGFATRKSLEQFGSIGNPWKNIAQMLDGINGHVKPSINALTLPIIASQQRTIMEPFAENDGSVS